MYWFSRAAMASALSREVRDSQADDDLGGGCGNLAANQFHLFVDEAVDVHQHLGRRARLQKCRGRLFGKPAKG